MVFYDSKVFWCSEESTLAVGSTKERKILFDVDVNALLDMDGSFKSLVVNENWIYLMVANDDNVTMACLELDFENQTAKKLWITKPQKFLSDTVSLDLLLYHRTLWTIFPGEIHGYDIQTGTQQHRIHVAQ